MAKMFPEQLRSNISSNAEKHLYQKLQKQLSDDFVVFHQVRWQVREPHKRIKDVEADFVIACPNLGILLLEVKGGKIKYDGATDKWYSNHIPINDPFQQACDHKYSLIRWLRKLHYWKNHRIFIGHAIAFPDSQIKLSLQDSQVIVLDSTQIDDLSEWVKSVLTYYRHQDQIQGCFDNNSVKELIKVLSPSIIVRPDPNGTELELLSATAEQTQILDFLANHRRVAISGCAGSGKTLLALEKARRLYQQGFNILLVCYNKALASFMQDFMRQSLGGWKPNMHVYTFHGICEKLFRQAGIAAPSEDIPKNKCFNEIYPNLLTAAADKLNWRVDAVIIDEGQDFHENWWLALKCLLRDPDYDIFYFFYDDNQRIYNVGQLQMLLEEAPFPLTKNCRNTQRIHSYVLQFYNGKNLTVANQLVGREVETHNYRGDIQLKNTLSRLLHRLVVNEGFRHQDIVILTTSRKQTLQNSILGQFRVRAHPTPNSNEILCNTIYYFKGLESPVVIIVKTELHNDDSHKKLMYVGASRARHYLIVLQPN